MGLKNILKKKNAQYILFMFIKRIIPIRPLTCKNVNLLVKLNIGKYKSRQNYQKANILFMLRNTINFPDFHP